MTTVLTREGPVDMVAVRAVVTGSRPAALAEHEVPVAAHLMLDAGISRAEVERRLHLGERDARRIAKEPPPVDRDGNPITLNS